MVNRRRTLQVLSMAAFGGGLGLPSLVFSQDSPAAPGLNPLRIPPLDSGDLAGPDRRFDLDLQSGRSNFLPGIETPTLGINGPYLGPTLRFRRFENVSLNVRNRLAEDSTLHWHGFHLPAAQDGGPHQVVRAGGDWNASYQVVQYAGTYWYHSHLLDHSGEQVYRGLAGLILIDDPNQQQSLPSRYGVDDIPLIVQDRRFNDDGSFSYMDRYDDMVVGMHGDTILVNGTWRPRFSPSARRVRFRILNASNARTYTFAFSDGREFHQVASDGGLLERPVALTRLELAAAERAEIIVEFEPASPVRLVNLGSTPNFPEFPGAMSRMMRTLNSQDFDILSIEPAPSLTDNAALPDSFESIYRLPEAAATNVRHFQLSMGAGMRSGNDAGPGTGLRSGLGGGHGGGNFYINGRRMNMDFINERIELNTTEIWELTNNSPMMHPFHVHNGQFQVLDRNGAAPPANEMGWKDTVRVGSGELVRIIMRFTDYIDPDNPYMYHCHILEHEDRGMMGQFVLV